MGSFGRRMKRTNPVASGPGSDLMLLDGDERINGFRAAGRDHRVIATIRRLMGEHSTSANDMVVFVIFARRPMNLPGGAIDVPYAGGFACTMVMTADGFAEFVNKATDLFPALGGDDSVGWLLDHATDNSAMKTGEVHWLGASSTEKLNGALASGGCTRSSGRWGSRPDRSDRVGPTAD